MISLTDCEGSQEPTTPTRISAGSLATVFDSPGRIIATKVTHSVDHVAQVEWEFTSLQAILAATKNDPDMLFMLNRPLAFYDPQSQRLLFNTQSTRFPPGDQGALAAGRRSVPQGVPPFTPNFVSDLPQRLCYVMDRAAPLLPRVALSIREHFYPVPRAPGSSGGVREAPPPVICRLYFGKELLPPSVFVNPVNFPLDAAGYDDDMPTIDEAEGIIQMLAAIYLKVRYDARGIDSVMRGGGADRCNLAAHDLDRLGQERLGRVRPLALHGDFTIASSNLFHSKKIERNKGEGTRIRSSRGRA